MPKSSPSLSTYTTMMRVNSKGRPYAKVYYTIQKDIPIFCLKKKTYTL